MSSFQDYIPNCYHTHQILALQLFQAPNQNLNPINFCSLMKYSPIEEKAFLSFAWLVNHQHFQFKIIHLQVHHLRLIRIVSINHHSFFTFSFFLFFLLILLFNFLDQRHTFFAYYIFCPNFSCPFHILKFS